MCIIPPAFMMLKGPLTNCSGTLLGSVISIGPVGHCITGMALPSHSTLASYLVVRRECHDPRSIGGDPSGLSGRVIAVFTREAKDTNELSVLRLAPQTPLRPISPANEF
jgi:hypothetical protein